MSVDYFRDERNNMNEQEFTRSVCAAHTNMENSTIEYSAGWGATLDLIVFLNLQQGLCGLTADIREEEAYFESPALGSTRCLRL